MIKRNCEIKVNKRWRASRRNTFQTSKSALFDFLSETKQELDEDKRRRAARYGSSFLRLSVSQSVCHSLCLSFSLFLRLSGIPIFEAEPGLRLLSLQHNLIKRVQHLETTHRLVFLGGNSQEKNFLENFLEHFVDI